MNIEEEKRKILNDYMKTATPEEKRELNRLLKSRENSGHSGVNRQGLNVDVKSMAKNMSRQINEQLGKADINIQKMARDLVAQMALQYKPDITDKELSAIIKQMVPEKKSNNISGRIPADIMKNMVMQFVSYSTGLMSERELSQFPDGWVKKYWGAFSRDIRDLITMYLKNGIDSRSFEFAVDRILSRK